jgi:hypothetical protein
MRNKELQPEPAVYYNDKLVSDESEHTPMVANEQANRMSDALAADQARKLGLTEEEISLLIHWVTREDD